MRGRNGRRDSRFVAINQVDGRSVIHPSLHGGAIRCAVAPYELLDRYRSDPAWFLQGCEAWTDIAVRLLFQPLPALCNLRVK